MEKPSFSDAILKCIISFQNENFQDRASNPCFTSMMWIEKTDREYVLTAMFPVHCDSYKKDYAVHDSSYIGIDINCIGNKACIFALGPALTPDILESAFTGLKSGKSWSINHQLYLQNWVREHTPMACNITFSKHGRVILIESIEIHINSESADRWYPHAFAYNSQCASK